MKKILTVMLLATLAGCSTTGGRCKGEFDYQKATTLPSVTEVGGVKITPSGSALVIPPPVPNGKPYAETYPDPKDPDDELIRCLDTPPVMPVTEAPEAPAKS